jgi:hypothetical protein
MAGFSKDDKIPDLQHGGLELYDDKDPPQSLCSSFLALVAGQGICSNPPLSSEKPSPEKKHFMDQVAHIQG